MSEERIQRLEELILSQNEKIDRLCKLLENSSLSSDSGVIDMSDFSLENSVSEYYTLDLFLQGERGIAKFIVDYIARDEDVVLYRCIDYKKASFVYIEDGKIKTDNRCKTLLDALQPHIVRHATRYYKSIINKIYSDDTELDDETDSEDDEINEIIANQVRDSSGQDDRKDAEENEVDKAVHNFLQIKNCICKNRNKLIKELCDSLYS